MKKILGLILELNPPHYGHEYFIKKAKELVNPDCTIAVLSSNFTMRGDISVVNKFEKTSISLDNGIDIVMELPFRGAVASADYFCTNAIEILVQMGVTDVAFGCEMASLSKLKEINDLTSTPLFNMEVKANLEKGYSYSTSCNKALSKFTTDLDLLTNYSLPNNTLGLQYLKALEKHPEITVTVIQRINNNYYDDTPALAIASAQSIRKLIREHKSTFEYTSCNSFIDITESENRLFDLLKYQFITTNISKMNYLGIKEGIENRLLSSIDKYSLEDFINSVCTKRYNANYIKRLLLHIIMKTPSNTSQYINYLRVLGFTNAGIKHIRTLPKIIKEKIITTVKEENDENVSSELMATKIYGLITNNPLLYLNEYKIPIRR